MQWWTATRPGGRSSRCRGLGQEGPRPTVYYGYTTSYYDMPERRILIDSPFHAHHCLTLLTHSYFTHSTCHTLLTHPTITPSSPPKVASRSPTSVVDEPILDVPVDDNVVVTPVVPKKGYTTVTLAAVVAAVVVVVTVAGVVAMASMRTKTYSRLQEATSV